ncbi:DMT family transporter [Chloroflexota bacterium]
MENGLFLALLASVSYAASAVYVRRGASRTGEAFTMTAISIFIGVPLFAALILFSGEWGKLWPPSWQVFIMLGIAGIIHFVPGRFLSYNSIRLIGANKASAFLRTTPFYTVVLSVIFLNEAITISLVFGVLGIFVGAVLVSTERKSVSTDKQGGFWGTEFNGILNALGGALCWGISPVLIRPAVVELGSSIVASFISCSAASIVMAFFFFRRQHREQLAQLRNFAYLTPIIISGIFVGIAQLLNYSALRYSPANMVTPLIGTSVLFVFFFSFFLNRKIEVFTLKVILGMVATVVGTYLIFT